jgi:hypothetical protein
MILWVAEWKSDIETLIYNSNKLIHVICVMIWHTVKQVGIVALDY